MRQNVQTYAQHRNCAIANAEAVQQARHTWWMDAHWPSTCTMYSAGHVLWSGMDRWSTLPVFYDMLYRYYSCGHWRGRSMWPV